MTLRRSSRIRLDGGAAGAVCLVALALLAGPCLGQGGPRTIVPPSIASEGPTHIGVMGGVARPGTYVEDQRSPLLVDVVRHAGGLIDGATGNVRVVRNGRAGQQTFYTPSLEYRLQPGDLLVVDTYPAHQSRQRVDEAAREGGAGAVEEPVQLAFLNVVGRPVVLKMRPENATLSRITRFLNQTPDAAESIRVVETGPQYTRGERDVRTRLVTGSVVIFDASRIDVAELPELPPAIGGTEPTGRSFAASRSRDEVSNGPPTAAVASPRPLDQLPLPARGGDDGHGSREVDAVPASRTRPGGVPAMNASLSRSPLGSPTNPFARNDTQPPRRVVDIPPTEPPISESPAPADGPLLGPGPSAGEATTNTETRSAVENAREAFLDAGPTIVANLPAENEETRAAIDAEAAGIDGAPSIDSTSKPGDLDSTSEPTTAANAADTGSLAIVIGVLVTAGILIWLLSRRPTGPVARESIDVVVEEEVVVDDTATTRRFRIDTAREEPVHAAHAPGLGRSTLDELIEGEVTFQEEPVNLPASLQLFGKATGERRFRVDAAEEPRSRRPRRPHFLDTPTPATETVTANATPEEAASEHDETSTDSPSRLRMLDRVLTVVHGGNHS